MSDRRRGVPVFFPIRYADDFVILVSGTREQAEHEKVELAEAHPRDLAISSWYSVLSVIGVIWLVWFFKAYFWPATVMVGAWMVGALFMPALRSSPGGSCRNARRGSPRS